MRSIYLLIAVLSAVAARAQLNGRVVEVSGDDSTAIPGVVLFWKNTSVTATSDSKGTFTIEEVPGNRLLEIRALGYQTRTVTVKDTADFITVVLKTAGGLQEVEIVYYSSGTEISMLHAQKIETLNERSLMKAACCNLSESFETNPSIDVNFSDAISGTKQIQMLGLSGQYAQITKENMPYLRGLASNYGLMFIPGTWISSIQLSKGAGSVINGYESFTGQINTELHHPHEMDRIQFNTYVNENARNEYNLNARVKLNKNLSTAVLSHVSANPLAEDLNKDGFADIPTGRQYNFMNKYDYNSPSGFEAQFGAGYLHDERTGGQFASMSKAPELYRIRIENEKWEVYSKTGYVFTKHPGTSMGLQLSYLDHRQDDRFGRNAYKGRQRTFYANYIFQGIIGTTDHIYKIGSSYMNDQVTERFAGSPFSRSESVAGVFTEYAYSHGKKFNLVAGLRGDYHNLYGFFATPRLHVRYAFTERSVLRFSGGRALRTANIFCDNLYLMASSRTWSVVSSNTNLPYGLEPETGWNYGLNFTQKFRINYREAYVTLDVYRTDFTSQVIADLDASARQVLIYNLRGPSFSNTFQFEFSMEPRKRLFVKTAYRFVDTRMNFRSGLLTKPLVAMHRAFINGSYETRKKNWQFDATVQYNGVKRLQSTVENPAEYARPAYSPDFFNVLAQVTWLTKIKTSDLHLYLGVENLLNYRQLQPLISADDPFGKFFDASVVWGPVYGRMLYAGLRWKLK